MLEMNHQLASRGDYVLNIDQRGLVKALYGSNLSLSERAKGPGWLWGKQAGPEITREATTIHHSSRLRDWTERIRNQRRRLEKMSCIQSMRR